MPNWIRCDERMPPLGVNVVAAERSGLPMIAYRDYNGGRLEWWKLREGKRDVLYGDEPGAEVFWWMPLPTLEVGPSADKLNRPDCFIDCVQACVGWRRDWRDAN